MAVTGKVSAKELALADGSVRLYKDATHNAYIEMKQANNGYIRLGAKADGHCDLLIGGNFYREAVTSQSPGLPRSGYPGLANHQYRLR